MAFKNAVPPKPSQTARRKSYSSSPRRKILGVLLHQGQIMQRYRYVAEAQTAPDVALQLPTGGGKMLVGRLIGEWLRAKNAGRIVYLCPTRQLVNQDVAQAEGHSGLSVHGVI